MFRRILSDVLFAIGVLWQLFLFLGVTFTNRWVQDFWIFVLFSLVTVGILYVSLKIRTPRSSRSEKRPEV